MWLIAMPISPIWGSFVIGGVLLCRAVDDPARARRWKPVLVCALAFLAAISSVASYSRNRAWKDGVTLWDDVLRKFPSSALSLNNRRLAKWSIKDFPGAREDLTKPSRWTRIMFWPTNDLGMLKFNSGEYQGAIQEYERAIRANPKDALAYFNRAVVRENLKDYREAIQDYTARGAGEPAICRSVHEPGECGKQAGTPPGGPSDLNRAIELAPHDEKAYLNRGLTKEALQDFTGAMQDYAKAIGLGPDQPTPYYHRGNAKAALKDYQAAIEAYNQAIRLDPAYAIAYHNHAAMPEGH